MNIRVRQYREPDLEEMIRIWNEVVEDGVAFPQEELLTMESGNAFFAEQKMRTQAKFMDYIFYIQTISVAAGIYAMQVMRSAGMQEDYISGKNLCWTVWNREQDITLKFCSLMRWLRPMSMQDTCMKDWDLSSLG